MPTPKSVGDLVTAADWNQIGAWVIASTVTSGTDETFTIPDWVNVLDVTVSRRHDGTGFQTVGLRFNGVGTASYQRYLRLTEFTSGGSATESNVESLTATEVIIGYLPSGTAEGSMTARIGDVNRTERSTVHVLGGYSRVGNDHRTWIGGGRFDTLAAVTSVTVRCGGSDSFASAKITLVGYIDAS